jgi:hypothetical protein
MLRSERRQSRVLFRAFFFHVVDLEVLAPGGDIENLMIQCAAILAGFNFVVAYVIVPRYLTSTLPQANLQMNAWVDEEFLISTTISIVGLFTVLAWDTLLPDLRDSYIFGVLPIRTRTIAFAKLAATGCALGLTVLLVNLFTSFCFAVIATGEGSTTLGVLRTFGSYWITMVAAALFTVNLLITIQGLTAQLLNYRTFVRVSGLIQLVAFFSILAIYFLKPSIATIAGLTAPQNERWLRWLPSYWFLGLFHKLNGSAHPVFAQLAARATWMLISITFVAALTLFLAYRSTIRRIIELPDISPADRRWKQKSLNGNALIGFFFRKPMERAILLFTYRTMSRSRKHRLLLALYSGIGLAVAFAYTESLLHGNWDQNWNHVNAPLLVANLVVLFFVVLGTRVVFTFPHTLRCNWIFRVTAVQDPGLYFLAIRKALYAVAACPVWILSAVFFSLIWPTYPAVQHLLLLILTAVIVVERSLNGFRKIPFACSYLPGKANLKVTIGIYASLILFTVHQGGLLEFWAMARPVRYFVLISLLCLEALWAHRRFNVFAAASSAPIQFEDASPEEILRIDFHRDR